MMETKRKRIDSNLITALAEEAGLNSGEFIARLVTLYQLIPFNSYVIRVIEMFPNLTALVSTIQLWSKLDKDSMPLPILEDDLSKILRDAERPRESQGPSPEKKIKL